MMDEKELRDIIVIARLEMLKRIDELERLEQQERQKPGFAAGQNANEIYGKRHGIHEAIQILDYHIRRVYETHQMKPD